MVDNAGVDSVCCHLFMHCKYRDIPECFCTVGLVYWLRLHKRVPRWHRRDEPQVIHDLKEYGLQGCVMSGEVPVLILGQGCTIGKDMEDTLWNFITNPTRHYTVEIRTHLLRSINFLLAGAAHKAQTYSPMYVSGSFAIRLATRNILQS